MKTVTIMFPLRQAEVVGILLFSLELKIIMTWCIEGGMFDDTVIYCICKLNESHKSIPPELQLEKIREKSFIKIKS